MEDVKKIFYTDDDRDDQEIFRDAAREVSAGLQVWIQSDGGELMSLLNNPPPQPHIIFLDLNMPVKNGYQILQEIRESEELKDFPVIVFSTSDDLIAIDTTRKLGANLYIPKPSSYSLLKKVIKHSLSINWDTFMATDENFVYRAN